MTGTTEKNILKVAINVPLSTAFDYLPPAEGALPAVGCRVRVPFGAFRATLFGRPVTVAPIDLSKVTTPIYLQASREDHIAPYPSVFKAKKLFSGPVRFVLAGSGHIAGVINPPSANKYNYWMNEEQPADLDEWIDGAESHPGSWWDDWDRWLSKLSGSKVPARTPGDGELAVIEDAPGSYAKTS